LFDLVQSGGLVCYPDAGMRLAVSRAVALDTPRGWRIAKEKQSHKIDVVVALAMACFGCVQGQHDLPPFDHTYSFVDTDRDVPTEPGRSAEQQKRDADKEAQRHWDAQRMLMHIRQCGIQV
jgi:hypothetical protein